MKDPVSICELDTRENDINVLATKVGMVFQNPEAQLFNVTVEDEWRCRIVRFRLKKGGVYRASFTIWSLNREMEPNKSASLRTSWLLLLKIFVIYQE